MTDRGPPDGSVPAVEVTGLRKSYGALEAVAGVDLTIHPGEVFALLGPNGAGKTTTVEILEGFRDRDGGEVTVLGHDPAKHSLDLKSKIGIVLQSTGMDPYLTVVETLDMFAGSYPSPRPAEDVIELVGLTEKRDVRVNKLSGGQQRRLDVGVALVGDPQLLFLDEPTTGFDPDARRGAWELIRNLRSLGKTVLLTTHYMDEAQQLADRVAVIAAGRIVAAGTPDTLGGREQAATLIRVRVPAAAPALPDGLGTVTFASGGDPVDIHTHEPVQALHLLTGWALEHGVALPGLEVSRPSLEDVYLQLTRSQQEEPS